MPALLARAGGILRAHLTQEERERLARLLVELAREIWTAG
jgi:hypothetical protein